MDAINLEGCDDEVMTIQAFSERYLVPAILHMQEEYNRHISSKLELLNLELI